MSSSKCRLLIIDDERDLLAALSIRFQASGRFLIETAVDGQDGLDAVERFQPDAILLDLSMPRMDGWEVCRRLKANDRTKNIPVVIMTAASAKALENRANGLGVRKILVKPFDEKELINEVIVQCGRGGP